MGSVAHVGVGAMPLPIPCSVNAVTKDANVPLFRRTWRRRQMSCSSQPRVGSVTACRGAIVCQPRSWVVNSAEWCSDRCAVVGHHAVVGVFHVEPTCCLRRWHVLCWVRVAGGSGGRGNGTFYLVLGGWPVDLSRNPSGVPRVPHGRDRSASEDGWQWDRRFTRYSSEGDAPGRCGHSRGMAVERSPKAPASSLDRCLPARMGFSGVRALRVRAGATYHLWDLALRFT